MQTRKLATATIASAVFLLGGLTGALALPTGAINMPSHVAAPSNPETDAGIIKVRRGFRRGGRHYRRRHFGRRHFRFRIHRGGYRSFYGFRRHRFYRRPYDGFRGRHYSRRRHYRRY